MRISRKVRERIHYVLICLLILLVFFSNIIPSIASLAQAEEGTTSDANATATDSNWLTYKYDNFSNDNFNQLFTVNGSAEVPSGSDFIRLTPTLTEQSGAVFHNQKLCPVNNYSFSTAFSFMMSNPSAEGPSDGMTFTLQTGTTSQPVPGGSIGYYGISPSFTIKYDTFLNEVYNDPSSNYIGLAQNGGLNNQDGWYTDLNQYNADNGTNFVLSNGTMYYTWIDYDSVAQNVQVLLGTSPDRASAQKVLDVNGIDLSTIFGGEPIHAGFTGSTGYPNYETHDVHSWYFVNDYAPITTLDPQNDYKIAPNSVELTTEPTSDPGVYNVTATLTDPSGNPVSGAVPDTFTTTSGELTGPNGEPLTELVSDAEGKIHAVLVNADHSTDVTVSASVNCIEVSETIPASEQPPEVEEPPAGACPIPVALINGSFEEGPERGSYQSSGIYFYESEVPGWLTTDDSQGVKIIEIWNYELGMPAGVTSFSPPVDGDRWAELNAYDNGLLYQDVVTAPGQTIYWRLSHMGRQGVDTMQVRIGAATNNPYDTIVQTQMSTGNTAWETYTGSYTVPAGQTMTRFGFEAVSTGGGSIGAGNFLDDIFLGTEPCIVAEKTVSPEGEVYAGQELTYEVTIKNQGGDIAANTIFEDAIPTGTEYVPGSLKIVDGPGAGDLTDQDGDDAGRYDERNNKVIIDLGDLPNSTKLLNGVTVQFKVSALDTESERVVTNRALVNYNNLLTDESESTESNETRTTVLPRDEIDACAVPVALINGDVEEPEGPGTYDNSVAGGGYYYADTVPGWETTDLNRTPRGIIQIMDPARPSTIPSNTPNQDNLTSRFAELNADTNSMLYQELPTVPGQTIYWRLDHRGYSGVDTMSVNIGPVTADPYNTTPEIKRISTGTTWETYSGSYTVPAGQTMTRFGFKAISTSTGALAFGNYLDNIFLGTEPCVIAEKTVSPVADILAGEELTYEVTIKNNGGDIAANTTFEDAIPAGTEYVPGSLKIIDGPGAGDLTDQSDDDAGRYDEENSKVIIELGNLPNTNDLPDGVTVQFKVRALVDDTISEITNKAQIGYDNLLINERETTESNETTTGLTYKSPVLDSQKVAEIAQKAEGNEDAEHPEVGDTLLYTIQTRNTVENSLVKNLVISDTIPEGLEYVPGSLTVDGEAVSDVEGDDTGHSVNGVIVGQVGDVTDTDLHTVTFQVVVGAGQASKDIINTAVVDGDNVDTPDEPEHELLVYPRLPTLESEKTSSIAEKGEGNSNVEAYQVGDTIEYTIRSRNNVKESLVTNFVISDELPEGLTFVEGSLEASHEGTADFANGTITAKFGDVSDTEWRTVTFQATIDSGQVGNTLRNVATADGDNVDVPSEPRNEITVEPRVPVLESEKTSTIAEKAEGNTDEAHPEVGDILTYTIQTRNTISDSLIENLTISDIIPEGLEYVAGSLIVDGQAVTDSEGDDNGYFVNGEVVGQLGDITDTEWHNVTFQVVVGDGQASKDIINTAVVDGDNVETPDEPEHELLVYPRVASLESEKTSSIVVKGEGNSNAEAYQVGDTIEYTIQSRNTVKESLVTNLVISDVLPEGLTFVEGSLVASHDGTADIVDGNITANFGDVSDTEWRTVTFQATIDSGQVGNTLRNVATVDGDNIDVPDQPENEFTVEPRVPVLESEKTSTIAEKADGNTDMEHAEVGDILTYTIQTRNTITDSLIENLTISDIIPEGLEYVPGTLATDGVAVSDEEDDDAGHILNGEVIGQFGDITDTEWHTVTFQVVVGAGQASKDIINTAVVDGDNVETPDEPEHELLVYPRAASLESEKTSSIVVKGEGNSNKEAYQVGDTIEYTIQSRNTVKESLVTNLVISDVLPEGLTFVEGSLVASHDGTADIVDGNITANFGDVSDTEWRTVTFQATIDSGQVGNTLRNVATVDGDNIDVPDQPENEFTVEPKEPVLESRKTATLTEKADGNTDTEHAEVGDILTYTIETRNTIVDSLVSNLVISDTLPEGLEYVVGSLTVDGQEVTDSEDEDNGYFAGGEVVGQFGDVTDNEWHTVTFQVTVGEGQASKDIINTAVVGGDNVDTPDKPEHELLVYPRYPALESEKTAVNAEEGKENYEVGDTVLYTIRARNTVKDSVVEDLVISDELPEGLTFVKGSIEASHEGSVQYKDGTITASFGDVRDTEWRTITFQVHINSDQFGKSIENIGTVDAGNIETPDTPSEKITIDKEVIAKPGDSTDGKELPKTSTNHYNFLLVGAALTLIGFFFWVARRKLARH